MEETVRVESVDDEEELNLMDTGGDEFSGKDQKEGEERDILGDGGVLKKLIKAGEGWEQPEKDDKVFVHYTGTLTDGTKFDSSLDRGTPFDFTLGHGSVIKGWDTVVPTMKKGEKVQVTLRSDYAYGERGSPPNIPPNATLVFEIELLRWESVNDLSDEKDGSLMKKIIKEGALNVWDKPKDEDLVVVKISAQVAGSTDFFEKDLVQEFTVGDGFFCPAVQRVVRDMKQGETVHVKAGPKYGFGEQGREGCPPGSAIELDIELQHVKTVKSIDPEYQGLVVKTILKDGAAYNTPNDTAEVQVSWTSMLADGTEYEPKVEEKSFTMKEDPFPNEALELAIMSMRSGEEAEVEVKDPSFAFGEAGIAGKVPPNERVRYRIILHSFQNGPESWDMKPEQKLTSAEELKLRGNNALKAGNLRRARRLYGKVENLLTAEHDFSEEEKMKLREIQLSTSLNTAAAALKQGQLRDCIKACDTVLSKHTNHVKALYRRSQAYMEQGDLFEAESDIKAALLVDNESKELVAASKRLKMKMKEAKKRDAKLFGAMFSKVGRMYEDIPLPSGPINEVENIVQQDDLVKTEDDNDLGPSKNMDATGDAIMKDNENVCGNI